MPIVVTTSAITSVLLTIKQHHQTKLLAYFFNVITIADLCWQWTKVEAELHGQVAALTRDQKEHGFNARWIIKIKLL